VKANALPHRLDARSSKRCRWKHIPPALPCQAFKKAVCHNHPAAHRERRQSAMDRILSNTCTYVNSILTLREIFIKSTS
jgi:hypothetical protein